MDTNLLEWIIKTKNTQLEKHSTNGKRLRFALMASFGCSFGHMRNSIYKFIKQCIQYSKGEIVGRINRDNPR